MHSMLLLLIYSPIFVDAISSNLTRSSASANVSVNRAILSALSASVIVTTGYRLLLELYTVKTF